MSQFLVNKHLMTIITNKLKQKINKKQKQILFSLHPFNNYFFLL